MTTYDETLSALVEANRRVASITEALRESLEALRAANTALARLSRMLEIGKPLQSVPSESGMAVWMERAHDPGHK